MSRPAVRCLCAGVVLGDAVEAPSAVVLVAGLVHTYEVCVEVDEDGRVVRTLAECSEVA